MTYAVEVFVGGEWKMYSLEDSREEAEKMIRIAQSREGKGFRFRITEMTTEEMVRKVQTAWALW